MISLAGRLGAGLRILLCEVKLQLRGGLYAAYGAVTLFFLLVLAVLPAGLREEGLGVIILMDPSFMGFYFAGGLILLEREQGVLPVFQTRGRGFGAYWRAKAAAVLLLAFTVVTALTGMAAALGLIQPEAGDLVLAAAGLLLTVPLFLSLGLTLAGFFPEIINYFLFSSLILTPFLFPLAELFGFSVGWWGILSPVWGGVVLTASGFGLGAAREGAVLAGAAGSLLVWNGGAFWAAGRSFQRLAAGGAAGRKSGGSGRRKAGPSVGGLSYERALFRLLGRDPISLMLLAAPLLIALVLGRGVPWLLSPGSSAAAWVSPAVREAAAGVMDPVRSFALLLGPLMLGMAAAFLFLDEKDGGVLPFLKTQPRRRGWYLLRLGGLFLLVHILFLVPSILLGDLYHGGRAAFLLSLAVDALIVPFFLLSLGILAGNKVQGLALAKVLNALCLPPVIIYLLPGPWAWLAGLMPTGWGSLLRLQAAGPGQAAAAAVSGSSVAGASGSPAASSRRSAQGWLS